MLRTAVLTLTKPGEGVIVQPPVYGPFYASISENQREIVSCSLLSDEKGYYTMDFESVEKACRNGAKLMMLCNPHNPIGRCWNKEELAQLLEILQRYGVPLVSDEIHEDFIYEGHCFTPVLSLAEKKDQQVIALTSASKTFNLAGLQQAVLFCRDQSLLKKLEATMRRVGVVQGNIFAMTATEAAFRSGDAWLDAVLPYIKQGEELFRVEIEKRLPKAILSPLEATYLGWLDLRAYGLSTEDMIRRCREESVEFTPGTFFGKECGESFLRINYACPHSHVLKAALQLEKAILKV